jgi:hypothetical protein
MPLFPRPPRAWKLVAAASLATAGLAAASLATASAAAPSAAPAAAPSRGDDPGSRPPAPGRWVVMEQGSVGSEPLARLRQERWHADGRLEGVLLERRDRNWRERAYVGQWRPAGPCRVNVERLLAVDPADARPREVQRVGAVLDRAGRPAYSLDLAEGTVLSGRWWPQADGPCATRTLAGVVLSQQQGLSWESGAWRPNAVVQRELWRDGRVQGLALMSVAGRQEEVPYNGNLSVAPSCLATIHQKDGQGVLYNYRAVLLANGSGYFYLQTDPDDLTVGWLEHR